VGGRLKAAAQRLRGRRAAPAATEGDGPDDAGKGRAGASRRRASKKKDD
jgi:hypothetical protein